MRLPLDKVRIDDLRSRYPSLPDEYLAYLSTDGWGEAQSGRMIYEEPVDPGEVYVGLPPSNLVLLGDDLAGYCLCFDLLSGEYGELSPSGARQVLLEGWRFIDYVQAP